jgi:hypothetical protein
LQNCMDSLEDIDVPAMADIDIHWEDDKIERMVLGIDVFISIWGLL